MPTQLGKRPHEPAAGDPDCSDGKENCSSVGEASAAQPAGGAARAAAAAASDSRAAGSAVQQAGQQGAASDSRAAGSAAPGPAPTAAEPQPEAQPPGEQQSDLQGAAPAASPPPLPPPPPPRPPRMTQRSFYGGRIKVGGSGGRTRGDFVSNEQLRHILMGVRQRLGRWQHEEASGEAAPPPVWQTFPTQQPAFDLADSQPGLDVFSVEHGPEGRRRFLVAPRAEFWRRYKDMLPGHKHWYEIIRHGAPCHLYFDLEFQTADNPGLDGAAAVDALLGLLGEQLRGAFQLELQDGWVLELDSSTPAKFSRHLIIRIPGAAFASNAHAGALVLQLCAGARARRGEDPRCALLVVRKGAEEALFIDPAVYSRNRAFRLHQSSKFGKQAVLRNTGRFGGAGLSEEEVFFASLITHVPPGARLLRCFDKPSEEAALGARRAAAAAVGAAGHPQQGAAPAAAGARVCYGPSPYPELEAFICSVCREGGVQGRVRSWLALGGEVLVFNMRDNRWCGHVGRAHKSNGVFYVVDLREGVWCQKCYDPECRHYRSPLTPLPPHLLGLCQPRCAGCGGAPGGGCACGQEGGWGDEEEESVMLQALDAYERQQQQGQPTEQQQAQPAEQQQEQQQPVQGTPAQPTPPLQQVSAPAGPPTADLLPDDDFLLQAVLDFEQQQAAAAAAPPAPCIQRPPTAPSPWAQQQPPPAAPPVKRHMHAAAVPAALQKRPLEIWEKLLDV